MAGRLYDKARNRFARGEISWRAEGGSVVRAVLLSAWYTPNLENHEFLSDVPTGSRFGAGGGMMREQAPQLVLLDPQAGVCDADDLVIPNVPAEAPALSWLLLFVDGGSDESSPLLALIEVPVVPTGGDVLIEWDNGPDKVFKL